VTEIDAFILAAVALFIAFFVKLAVDLAIQEIGNWLPHLAEAIVRRAARALPIDQRSRWEREAISDIRSLRDRPLASLAHSLDVALSVRALRKELARTPAYRHGHSLESPPVIAEATSISAPVPPQAGAAQIESRETDDFSSVEVGAIVASFAAMSAVVLLDEDDEPAWALWLGLAGVLTQLAITARHPEIVRRVLRVRRRTWTQFRDGPSFEQLSLDLESATDGPIKAPAMRRGVAPILAYQALRRSR
jgi:hypothetical protein